MNATFKGNPLTLYYPVVFVTICNKHTRSRKIQKPLLKETPGAIPFFSCNSYNMYCTYYNIGNTKPTASEVEMGRVKTGKRISLVNA